MQISLEGAVILGHFQVPQAEGVHVLVIGPPLQDEDAFVVDDGPGEAFVVDDGPGHIEAPVPGAGINEPEVFLFISFSFSLPFISI